MDTLERELLVYASDDWLSLPRVDSVARRYAHGDLIASAMVALRSLADAGLIQIGDLNQAGFVRWDIPMASALDRFEREWRHLTGPAQFGDVGWIAITPARAKLARQLLAKEA